MYSKRSVKKKYRSFRGEQNKMKEALIRLEECFREFITDKEVKDELEFCLTQSQVEQFVRSKFAYWVHKKKFI